MQRWSDKIAKVPGVVSATPLVEGQALLTLNGYATGVQVRGLRPEDFIQKPAWSGHLVDGKAADFAEAADGQSGNRYSPCRSGSA